MKKIVLAMALWVSAMGLGADEFAEMDAGLPGWYLGGAVGALMPGGGVALDGSAAVSLRAGRYLTEYLAFELEGWSVPVARSSRGGDAALSGVSLEGLFHLSGWESFDRLFGCERFDPFATLGAGAAFADRHVFADGSHSTALGPVFGLGAFYHLTDSLSVRGDGRMLLACDTPAGVVFSATIGVQYSFGGGE